MKNINDYLTCNMRHLVILGLWLGSMSAFAQDWTPQVSNTNKDLHTIFFVNDQTGWAMGEASGGNAAGNIRHTEDQGMLWTPQFLGRTNAELNGSYFMDTLTGVAVGRHSSGDKDGLIIRTTDGGLSWTSDIHTFEEELFDVHFANSQTGWLVGEEGTIAKTMDGGITWTNQSVFSDDEDLFGVFALSPMTAVAVGEEGYIFRTTNGGQFWQQIGSPVDEDLHAVFFFDAQNGWAVGEEGIILKTSNGGMTWGVVQSGISRELHDVHFVSDQIGWVVGKYGVVRHTTNGGLSWTAQNSNTGNHIWALHMVSDSLGWFAGYDGMIHVYRDRAGQSQTTAMSENIARRELTISLFPNPWQDEEELHLIIDHDEWVSSEIRLMDLQGNTVQIWDGLFQSRFSLSLQTTLPNGVYMVVVNTSDGRQAMKKLLKM